MSLSFGRAALGVLRALTMSPMHHSSSRFPDRLSRKRDGALECCLMSKPRPPFATDSHTPG